MKRMTAQESLESKEIQVNPEGENSAQLDSALDGMEGGSERVSEIVGEKASENKAATIKNTRSQQKDQDSAIQSLSPQAQQQVIPSVAVQKKKIRKVLMKEQKNLLKEMKKMEKSRDFSANKMQTLIIRLRKVHHIMNELFSAAKDRVNNLYEQFVLKKG